MIFLYLLGLASFGIITLVIIEYIQSKKPLLQIIKNWCNIDTVLFEQKLKKSLSFQKNIFYKIYKKIKGFCIFCLQKIQKHSNAIRYIIRKKLHPQQTKHHTSDFIQKIKE